MSHASRVAVDELTASIVDVLGTGLRSVILHGSLATGDFRPGRSDVDVLAVVTDGLADGQADALEALVRRARLGDATGVDLHVVTADVAGTPTRTPPLELHVGRYRNAGQRSGLQAGGEARAGRAAKARAVP